MPGERAFRPQGGVVACSFHPEIQQNAFTSTATSPSAAHTNNSESVSQGLLISDAYVGGGLGHEHSQVFSPKRGWMAPQNPDLVGIFVPPAWTVRIEFRGS